MRPGRGTYCRKKQFLVSFLPDLRTPGTVFALIWALKKLQVQKEERKVIFKIAALIRGLQRSTSCVHVLFRRNASIGPPELIVLPYF